MAERDNPPILKATGVVAGYGGKQILSGVDLHVMKGELVAIVGHNGAGKTTLVKTLFGLVKLTSGYVELDSRSWRPDPLHLLRAGIVYVPQGNNVFPALSVIENLQLSLLSITEKMERFDEALSEVLELFPALGERLNLAAGQLSGGERQMLALARTLVTKPKLLLLDEPSLGLAPNLANRAFSFIQRLVIERQIGILVVEQKVRAILGVANRVYVLKQGQVVFHGIASELLNDENKLRNAYL